MTFNFKRGISNSQPLNLCLTWMLNTLILISTETLVRQNINIQIPTFEYHVGQKIFQELERFINV